MQKILLKFSPLLLLLLVFACVKDNDLTPLPEQVEQQQVLQAKGAKPCTLSCRKPDWINISDVKSCIATFSWGYNKKICGTFMVQLYNHSSGEWTYYNPAISPLTLSNLEPCTQYTIGVSHVTDKCASVPVKVSFQTDCKPCKSDCDIHCKSLDYYFVNNLSDDGATINFGHTPIICGTFMAQLRNNETQVSTFYNSVTSPWVLTDLDPCTSYTVSISHVTDKQACLPVKKSFTTDCEGYCDASGEDPSCLYMNYIVFDYSVPEDTIWCEGELEGYLDKTDEVLLFDPEEDQLLTLVGACFCQNLSSFYYFNIWVDLDDDGEFEANEHITSATYFTVNLGGLIHCENDLFDGGPMSINNACGLRARLIISTEEDQGPCDEFPIGQVVDFTVSSTDCSI